MAKRAENILAVAFTVVLFITTAVVFSWTHYINVMREVDLGLKTMGYIPEIFFLMQIVASLLSNKTLGMNAGTKKEILEKIGFSLHIIGAIGFSFSSLIDMINSRYESVTVEFCSGMSWIALLLLMFLCNRAVKNGMLAKNTTNPSSGINKQALQNG